MTRNFYKNWQRLISGIMLAILLMLNTMPIAHAVTKPHHQKSDQQMIEQSPATGARRRNLYTYIHYTPQCIEKKCFK